MNDNHTKTSLQNETKGALDQILFSSTWEMGENLNKQGLALTKSKIKDHQTTS